MAEMGLHHVTAFAGPAARNRTFYTRVLGLQLVKTTVNFDDPSTYHLYYGDAAGRPGSIFTFFPIPGAAPGRAGSGETVETALRVPRASLDFWRDHLAGQGASPADLVDVFGDPVLPFTDPDGTRLALVGAGGRESHSEPAGDVPAEHAISGLHGVTLLVPDLAPTGEILEHVLGFREAAHDGESTRYHGNAAIGGTVTLRRSSSAARGRQGAGSVHHVAFRAADDEAQAAMARRLQDDFRMFPTEQRDRTYFRSIYFREPGGVLFEIATDAPGFAVDEPPEHLGEALMLPPGLEPHREQIMRRLPDLEEER